jgi:hypothetical protein
MGLLVNVYKTEGRDCTNGGVSSKWNIKGLCLINVPGPFNPSEDYPAAQLVKQSFYFGDSVKIIPEECEGKQTMMGGNYAATSDSRFSDAIAARLGHNFYGAVPIHDRVEF